MTGFPASVRAIIRERAMRPGFGIHAPVCEVMARCHGARADHVHHRRARQMGSTKRPETNLAANGLAVCAADHEWIETNREQARAYGWLVRQQHVPAEIPCLYRGKWAILGDRGEVIFVPAPVRSLA